MARQSIVVVGAGIVGLAIAFHLYREGAEVRHAVAVGLWGKVELSHGLLMGW